MSLQDDIFEVENALKNADKMEQDCFMRIYTRLGALEMEVINLKCVIESYRTVLREEIESGG